jgi:hypothetical protein
MYFGAGVSKLQHAIKTVVIQWDGTAEGWRDQVRQDFGEKHLEPVVEQAKNTMRAMDQLADLFQRIYRDCS